MTQNPNQKNQQAKESKPESENADWGLDSGSAGMSGEAKIGIALVLVLICAFGFVLHKRLGKDGRLWQNIQAAIGIGSAEEEVIIASNDHDPDKQFETTNDDSQNQVQVQTAEQNQFLQQEFQQHDIPPAQGEPLVQSDQFQQDDFIFEQQNQQYKKNQQLQQQNAPQQFEPQKPAQNDPFFNESVQQHQLAQQSEPSAPRPVPVALEEVATHNQAQTRKQQIEDVPFDLAQEELKPVPIPQQSGQQNHDLNPGMAANQSKPGQAESLFEDVPVIGQHAEPDLFAEQSPAQPKSQQNSTQDLFAQQPPAQPAPTQKHDPFSEPHRVARPQSKQGIEYVQQPKAEEDLWNQQHVAQKQQQPAPHDQDQWGGQQSLQTSQVGFHGDGLGIQQIGAAHITVHTVRTNDNYWSISQKHYGTHRYYKALALFNKDRIGSETYLRSGMKVLIPEAKELEKHFPQLFPQKNHQTGSKQPGFFLSEQGEPMYRIGKHDNLTGIARRHLGRASRWRQIYALNQNRLHNPNNLQIGAVLRLPADASRVAVISR